MQIARLARQFTRLQAKSISSAALTVKLTDKPKEMLPNNKLVFGQTFSDHMLTIEFEKEKGWGKPEIKPYQKLQLDPSCTVFHYAVECFEGMKAYKDKQGKIRLFRPDMNMTRFLRSCERLKLPSFDKNELLKCIKEFVKTDARWIPSERGYSLYIRPTAIATQESLGVGESKKALVFCIASPVGPYYKTGFSAVKLFARTDFVRAWPGGTGDAKIGANYAPGILPQLEVAKDGYAQILWLFGEKQNITEVGTMNCFILWKNEKGEKELVTPPLDGTILPGVTRDSILSLCSEWNEFKVTEKPVTIHDVAKAVKENRVIEMFGAGTAAIVSPIKLIHYNGTDLNIPLDPAKPDAQAGPLTTKIADTIMGIQYGEIPHKWSVVVD
ncbi:branched-chain-amino-acid aminotransferase [Boothiomyces sp. JEL0866]|nr:branched-chain-amino-acid aminotransferase [Boothiomyces sp. JEL0866]